MITALCFKKVYDHDKLAKYIHTCDISFFERLVFKPYYIRETEYEDFKLNDVKIICPICGGIVAPIKNMNLPIILLGSRIVRKMQQKVLDLCKG